LDPAGHVERAELLEQVLASLATLPEAEREALVLTGFAELTHQAAADALGVARETISARVRRGMQKLREELGVEPERAAALASLATLGALGLAASRLSGEGGASALVATATGGAVLTSKKIALGLAGLALFFAGGVAGRASTPTPAPESARQRAGVEPPARSADPPAPLPAPEAPREAELRRELAAARARLATLEAERRQLEEQVAARPTKPDPAPAPREPSLLDRIRRAGALSADERSSAGWKLGRAFADQLSEDQLIDLLSGEQDPRVLEVLYHLLRAGASSRWKGGQLERVLELLNAPEAERRRCVGLLVASRVGSQVRRMSNEQQAAYERGQPADPALARVQRELERGLRRGDDALLASVGRAFATRAAPLWEDARKALREGVALASSHEGRLRAYQALARDPWGERDPGLFALYQSEQRADLRLAIAEASALCWGSRSSRGMFEEITPAFMTYYRSARDPRVRRELLGSWANTGLFAEGFLAKLRQLAQLESDPSLKQTILRLAAAVEAGTINGTRRLNEVLRGGR
ncbi:MAG TPA: hypothetical protein DEA08_38605, partial [Planctomycetes bacterium]|nr:hypothetical protein [Planctomycetota bacterium]